MPTYAAVLSSDEHVIEVFLICFKSVASWIRLSLLVPLSERGVVIRGFPVFLPVCISVLRRARALIHFEWYLMKVKLVYTCVSLLGGMGIIACARSLFRPITAAKPYTSYCSCWINVICSFVTFWCGNFARLNTPETFPRYKKAKRYPGEDCKDTFEGRKAEEEY